MNPWRIAIAASLVALSASGASDDYLEAYKRGYSSYQRMSYENVIPEMRKAIAGNPIESAQKIHIKLLDYKPYLPHYFLGRALAKVGQCPEAIAELNESLRQGVLLAEFRRGAIRGLAECHAVPLANPPKPVAAPAPVTTTEPEEKRETAQPKIEVPQPVPQPVPMQTPAPSTVIPATETQRPVMPPQTSADEQLLAARRETLRLAIERARGVLSSLPKDFASREAASLRTRLRQVDPGAITTQDKLLSATRDVTSATAEVERWLRERLGAAEPPAALVSGVDAYLRGDYASALRILDAAVFNDERSRAHALIFRAAASHALFVISHGRDKDLEARTVQDVLRYKELRAGALPDPRVFSPTFLKFVQQISLPPRQGGGS